MKKASKKIRILYIFEKLNEGKVVDKKDLAKKFGVSNKAIQRDINDLRSYFAEFHIYDTTAKIIYDRKEKGYILKRDNTSWLNKKEILAITKVLLESRAFTKEEINQLLNKLVICSEDADRARIEEVIKNERFHYNPIKNKESLFDIVWDLSQAISNKNLLEISYDKERSSKLTKRKLKPVGIIFSEFYFYLIAYIHSKDYDFPTVYRLDRIKNYKVNKKNGAFHIPYIDRFKEGEFRKRVQFMYPGKLIKLKFKFSGNSLEAVLDRLPTAKVIDELEDRYIMEAEVYGKGIKMWLLSQGQNIEVLEPSSLRKEMVELINKMQTNYIKDYN